MKEILLFILFCFLLNSNHAQKPSIDSLALSKWVSLGHKVNLSDDGKYIFYFINNTFLNTNALVIQAVNQRWKKEIPNVNDAFFCGNGNFVLYSNEDTLCIAKLSSNQIEKIIDVYSYKLSNDGEWLAIQFKNNRKFVLRNLITNNATQYNRVNDYFFGPKKALMLYKSNGLESDSGVSTLEQIILPKLQASTIWSAPSYSQRTEVVNSCFDVTGDCFSFIVKTRQRNKLDYTIWYFDKGMVKAKVCIDKLPWVKDSEFIILAAGFNFSANGKWISFKVQYPHVPSIISSKAVKVDVWSYQDTVLQSEQLKKNIFEPYTVAVNIEDKLVRRLNYDDERVQSISADGNFAVISDKNSINEHWFTSFSVKSYYLLDIRNGVRTYLKKYDYSNPTFSPDNKYLIFFDRHQRSYYCYDLKSNLCRNISKTVSSLLTNEYAYTLLRSEVGVAGWLLRDSGVLIYDNYDIWELDPLAVKSPSNLTNGYGKKNNIKLRIVNENEAKSVGISYKDGVLLTGFNTKNKRNGFYKIQSCRNCNPIILSEGRYIQYHSDNQLPYSQNVFDRGMKPIKAGHKNVWVIKRMTPDSAPNYYLTSDFKQYRALTNHQPQKDYNWYTTELITWKQSDGIVSDGILYKPENFNPEKKYPVIFNLYEEFSFSLFGYIEPGFTENAINIPWFLSRGYIIFRPDVHFSIANVSNLTNGENALNAVILSANLVKQLPWIDSTKIGIYGHSFGGFLTNYLITHTKLFAAAASSAGRSDGISSYLSLNGPLGISGASRQNFTEINQPRIGANLWERRDLYLRESPVLNADSVTSPLLIMHNKLDEFVPWGQGLEMYLALRRLSKRVWMLQYDGNGHSNEGLSAIDYTIRLTQYFDHYLKGKKPPYWMTKGIPGFLKGIESGFQLDDKGHCGHDCVICNR